jgi:hypothetical protein
MRGSEARKAETGDWSDGTNHHNDGYDELTLYHSKLSPLGASLEKWKIKVQLPQ